MKNMDRLFVLKSLMQHCHLKNYLEIGVFNGHIFFVSKAISRLQLIPILYLGMAVKP